MSRKDCNGSLWFIFAIETQSTITLEYVLKECFSINGAYGVCIQHVIEKRKESEL